MVIMASGIARGRVRMTTTATVTESRNMITMGGHMPNIRLTETLQPWFTVYFFDIGHHVMINRHLSKQGIC